MIINYNDEIIINLKEAVLQKRQKPQTIGISRYRSEYLDISISGETIKYYSFLYLTLKYKILKHLNKKKKKWK